MFLHESAMPSILFSAISNVDYVAQVNAHFSLVCIEIWVTAWNARLVSESVKPATSDRVQTGDLKETSSCWIFFSEFIA